MKKLLTIVSVLMFTLNTVAQEGEELNQEKFNEIALSPVIFQANQIIQEDLQAVIGSLNKIIGKNGKVAEGISSPYKLYLSYSFDNKSTLDDPTPNQIDVTLIFYVIDNISKRQTASLLMKINSKKSDELAALVEAILSIPDDNEDLQNVLRMGREEIYSMNVLQCIEHMNKVQIAIHENQHEKAIGGLLNLPEFEGECVMMSEQLLSEAVNSKKNIEATNNYESLKYFIEKKQDLSYVKNYANLLAKDILGKELLTRFIEGYSAKDEYLDALIEANKVLPIPVDDRSVRIQAKELILVTEDQKMQDIMMFSESEIWLNELKP